MVSAITILICLVHDEWHTSRYLEQDGSFSWTDYILFSRMAVPLCVQEICFSDASLGLQKQTNKQTNKNRTDASGRTKGGEELFGFYKFCFTFT